MFGTLKLDGFPCTAHDVQVLQPLTAADQPPRLAMGSGRGKGKGKGGLSGCASSLGRQILFDLS